MCLMEPSIPIHATDSRHSIRTNLSDFWRKPCKLPAGTNITSQSCVNLDIELTSQHNTNPTYQSVPGKMS